VIAQDVYDALTEKGYRVFFSRISLEDKLGSEYEPYIFAALNSAKVMLVFGTDYEYFNAVWVKNEWSRFLALIAAGQKKALIPCYKNLDAYDMPKDFAKLQAQDMGKVGAMQDLMRGIDKIFGKDTQPTPAKETVVVQQSGGFTAEPLVKRGYMALEDGDWEKAKDFFDQALNLDAGCAEAYLGLAMTDTKCYTKEDFFVHCLASDFQRAKKFGGQVFQEYLEDSIKQAKERQRADKTRLEIVRKRIAPVSSLIATGSSYTIAIKADGTVLATDEDCGVSSFTDIISVTTNEWVTYGVKLDGTVITAESDGLDLFNLSRWKNIVAIDGGGTRSGGGFWVGLKSNGTVVTVGLDKDEKRELSGWIGS